MNKNLILESVSDNNVYVYFDDSTRRYCGIVNRLFLDNPDMKYITSYARLKKHRKTTSVILNRKLKSVPCYEAWEIVHAAADRGTGIDLFFEVMSMPDVEHIMCDRADLSPDAEIAWKKIIAFFNEGSTVKLDNYLNPQTPDEIDDCKTWAEKYGPNNPYDQVIKVPGGTASSHQHIKLDELLDHSKLLNAEMAFRHKFEKGYDEMMIRRGYEPGS